MSDHSLPPALDIELTPTGLTPTGLMPTGLTPAGRARRADMLGDLLGRMDDVHRARRRRRRIVAGAHLLAAALLVAVLVPIAPVRLAGPVTEAPPAAPDAPRPVRFVTVETDPSIVDRYRVATASRTMIVDDRALLGALASIDRPTGLVRRGGRMWLTDDVVAPRLP